MTKQMFTCIAFLTLTTGLSSCKGQVTTDTINDEKGKPPTTTSSAKPKRTSGILHDRAGNVWSILDKSNGISRYDGTEFTYFTERDGLSSNKVWSSILEDNDGKIWFGTGDGVTIYDGKEFTVIPITEIRGNNLTSFYTYTQSKFDSFGMPWPLESSVLSILQDKSGMYWFGTVTGIYCFDGKKFTPFTFNNKLGMNPGMMNNEFLMEDKDGKIWIGGRGMNGIFCFDGKVLTNFTPDGTAWLWPLIEDNSGVIWFGSVSGRVYQYDGKSFSEFTEEKFPGGLNAMEQDKAGNLWFATQKAGVKFYDGQSFRNFTVMDGLGSNTVGPILEDKAGNIWFLTEDGLSKYDGQTFKNILH